MDSWFRMFSPAMSFRLPASGDVSMDYRPLTNWGLFRPKRQAGNPEIEAEVYSEVALPGKQLGKLTEATLALADLVEALPHELVTLDQRQTDAIDALRNLATEIQNTKDKHKLSAQAEAIQGMERFKLADPVAFESYVNQLQKPQDKPEQF